MSTVVPNNIISEALFGKVRSALLSELFIHNDNRCYMCQLVRLTGLAHGAVQRELANLVNLGLISRIENGNQVNYQANLKSAIYPDIKGILTKTIGITELVKNVLVPVDKIDFAFIYGSFARGELKYNSDIDIMVIGDIDYNVVVNQLIPLQDQLKREVNPSVFSLNDFIDRINHNEHFITSVLHTPKIMLIGNENELSPDYSRIE